VPPHSKWACKRARLTVPVLSVRPAQLSAGRFSSLVIGYQLRRETGQHTWPTESTTGFVDRVHKFLVFPSSTTVSLFSGMSVQYSQSEAVTQRPQAMLLAPLVFASHSINRMSSTAGVLQNGRWRKLAGCMLSFPRCEASSGPHSRPSATAQATGGQAAKLIKLALGLRRARQLRTIRVYSSPYRWWRRRHKWQASGCSVRVGL